MKNKLLQVFWLIIFLVGCAPLPKETPTEVTLVFPTPDALLTPTANPYSGLPSTTTNSDAQLFSGPGNTKFEVISNIPAGAIVDLIGIYGDFIKVHLPGAELMGYLWKNALVKVPDHLTVLKDTDVPMIQEDFVKENCMIPFAQLLSDGSANIDYYIPGPGNFGGEGAPINLSGQTVLTISMNTDNRKTSWVSLADLPKRPYGEWYLGFRRITIFKSLAPYLDGYTIEFRDGLSSDTITIPLKAIGDQPFNLILLDADGRDIQITDLDGHILYRFQTPKIKYQGTELSLPDGVFPKQIMYLSCEADGPTSVSYTRHEIMRTPTGKWEVVEDPIPSLLPYAQKNGIEIILPADDWNDGDQRYFTIVKQQSTMEYLGFHAPNFWLGKDRYNFDFLDHLTDYIVKDGRKIYGAIISGMEPTFIPEDILKGSFTREEYRQILQDYVKTVTCRYKDKVSIWAIAGETIGARVVNVYDFWADKAGPDYLDLVFQWTRECDPDGILLYGDTLIESPRSPLHKAYITALIKTIKDMKNRGIPVDAVGIEGHLFEPWVSIMVPPNKDAVIKTMQEYGALGVDVYITEMDVNLTRIKGTHDEKWAYQASIYKTMIDACLESGVCKGYGVFGVDDPHSWGMCFPEFDGCPPAVLPEGLWFDANFKPKPAFYAVLKSLQEH